MQTKYIVGQMQRQLQLRIMLLLRWANNIQIQENIWLKYGPEQAVGEAIDEQDITGKRKIEIQTR